MHRSLLALGAVALVIFGLPQIVVADLEEPVKEWALDKAMANDGNLSFELVGRGKDPMVPWSINMVLSGGRPVEHDVTQLGEVTEGEGRARVEVACTAAPDDFSMEVSLSDGRRVPLSGYLASCEEAAKTRLYHPGEKEPVAALPGIAIVLGIIALAADLRSPPFRPLGGR